MSFPEQNKFRRPTGLKKGAKVRTDFNGNPRKVYVVDQIVERSSSSGFLVSVLDKSSKGVEVSCLPLLDSSWFKVVRSKR